MKTLKRRLISAREFGQRLGGRSIRTVDRLIERNPPGLPEIIWINRIRYFDEDAVDAFIGTIIARGVLPGQQPYEPVGAAAAKAARGRRVIARKGGAA
jgi:hypothetical protein